MLEELSHWIRTTHSPSDYRHLLVGVQNGRIAVPAAQERVQEVCQSASDHSTHHCQRALVSRLSSPDAALLQELAQIHRRRRHVLSGDAARYLRSRILPQVRDPSAPMPLVWCLAHPSSIPVRKRVLRAGGVLGGGPPAEDNDDDDDALQVECDEFDEGEDKPESEEDELDRERRQWMREQAEWRRDKEEWERQMDEWDQQRYWNQVRQMQQQQQQPQQATVGAGAPASAAGLPPAVASMLSSGRIQCMVNCTGMMRVSGPPGCSVGGGRCRNFATRPLGGGTHFLNLQNPADQEAVQRWAPYLVPQYAQIAQQFLGGYLAVCEPCLQYFKSSS